MVEEDDIHMTKIKGEVDYGDGNDNGNRVDYNWEKANTTESSTQISQSQQVKWINLQQTNNILGSQASKQLRQIEEANHELHLNTVDMQTIFSSMEEPMRLYTNHHPNLSKMLEMRQAKLVHTQYSTRNRAYKDSEMEIDTRPTHYALQAK